MKQITILLILSIPFLITLVFLHFIEYTSIEQAILWSIYFNVNFLALIIIICSLIVCTKIEEIKIKDNKKIK